jgi:hypothetical protein
MPTTQFARASRMIIQLFICLPSFVQHWMRLAHSFKTHTFSGLAKVAIFTTNVDAENQTLINHKCVCGALNRHFCQTRVTCWRYLWMFISNFELSVKIFCNNSSVVCK